MPRFRGRWTARIEKDFEVEADNESDARAMVEAEMELRFVVEMLDMDIETIEEVSDEEDESN